jgi:ribosomal protein S27E
MGKDKTSIPEKYGMISCPQCDSIGKLFRGAKEFIVCPTCGGFGAIKKTEGDLFQPTGYQNDGKPILPLP